MPKIIPKLAQTRIESAKRREKDYKLYDGEGLQLLVRKSGKKVWQYSYDFKGKKSIYTIGEYHKSKPGCIGSSEARKKHDCFLS